MVLKSTRVLYATLLKRTAQGIASADELNTLALMTDSGIVSSSNVKRALVFLRAAAFLKHSCAVATLAAATQSMRWWRKAATEHNNAWAQQIVGDAFALVGNYTTATKWWILAYKNGDASAGVRLICLPRKVVLNPSVSHILVMPDFVEVDIPPLAVLWSVYFEKQHTVSQCHEGFDFDSTMAIYVSTTLPEADARAHLFPLVESLGLNGGVLSTTKTTTWVARPEDDTSVVSSEFSAAFMSVHTVSKGAGELIQIEAEMRPTPDKQKVELWFCVTFDSETAKRSVSCEQANDIAGVAEWRKGAPHAK